MPTCLTNVGEFLKTNLEFFLATVWAYSAKRGRPLLCSDSVICPFV